MPSKLQIDANRNLTNFSPVKGGSYSNGGHGNGEYGFWWSSEVAYNGARRYRLQYNQTLLTNTTSRASGYYIRCVSEEKTVTDLTYMQDMTPSIANWTPSL